MSAEPSDGWNRWCRIAPLVLGLLVLAVYQNSFDGPLVFDTAAIRRALSGARLTVLH